ncbi:unnamed protein product [Ranitomeya imitator]|uniref:G-protein coupled receptors family 1 profile domain-containing protein n=1 Tax=Ranitomeya imitator TaxID=111125 RepID=A0ABN9MDL3_9NEOB|nr:unnamed protein product [Ranitomeya imitator]
MGLQVLVVSGGVTLGGGAGMLDHIGSNHNGAEMLFILNTNIKEDFLQKKPNRSMANCNNTQEFRHTLYAVTYTIILIPGLLANSVALWLLRGFINKKNKAIIFMINLALADLLHVLSLPLRIYYYINHTWPFRTFLCLLCFYLKYLNMYASIMFLTLISVQRYVFTANPFKAKGWKRRYDVAICVEFQNELAKRSSSVVRVHLMSKESVSSIR